MDTIKTWTDFDIEDAEELGCDATPEDVARYNVEQRRVLQMRFPDDDDCDTAAVEEFIADRWLDIFRASSEQ